MITIDANPRAFLLAGITSMVEAQVLSIIGRSGGAGIRVDELAAATGKPGSAAFAQARRLVRKGLANAQRGNKQGRPLRFFLTPAGRAVLDQAIMVVDHSLLAQPPLPLS